MGDELLDEAAVARLRIAVATVQRDLDATGVQRRIELTGSPGGAWRISLAGPGGFSTDAPVDADDEAEALWSAANAAQDVILECLWQVWPVCREHRLGLHLWSAGASSRWTWDDADRDAPAWRCLAGTGHNVALVGELPR